MKQTIEIEVPDGKKAIWKDGRVVFEDIKPQLPKTWEEFCKQNRIKKGECLIDDCCCIKEILVSTRHERIDRSVLPNERAAEQHLALMQLHQLRDCYRQGWTPSYGEICYTINRFMDNSYYIHTSTTYSSFLTFQSKEIAKEFLDNFKNLIEQARDLI